ncbi:glycosyltransferase [Mycolicibacterium grossiae]|uniref:Glycosyltransferase n=1 Tax=Mycolicibacterium grossiae TaxID=1552759 RepID=A0A1E8Q125_9MYCO|nr:glycosyltransferase [Mycolicibacterium grossiae]OFJ52116.1 hypothetical protein BEL07_19145 [Mycolicibacterium grossiae]QEM46514.1 glycosyltransferase family 4 protein [Mycolicibacterium grossiae]
MGDSPRAVFINWFPYHGRSDGIARCLGIPAWFHDGGTGPTVVRELRRWRDTNRLLRRERPEAVLVMQPPIIVLWAIRRHARRTSMRIAGDLHTGVFDEPGNRLALRPTLRMLRRYGMAVVTNEALRSVAEAHGCPALVLHDPIEAAECDPSDPADPELAAIVRDAYVLVPLAYAHDEPIDALLDAARATPDLTWVLTGRAPRQVAARAPSNVRFPGYVSNDDFLRMVGRAGVVVAMTKNEHTMQRAAYEALSFGRPLVTSDTAVLREYYGGAAEIVAPRADDVAAGVRRALADPAAVERMLTLRERRIAEQHAALETLREWLLTGRLPDGR